MLSPLGQGISLRHTPYHEVVDAVIVLIFVSYSLWSPKEMNSDKPFSRVCALTAEIIPLWIARPWCMRAV